MHETYAVPSGQWENVYENFSPIAMGEFPNLHFCICPRDIDGADRICRHAGESKHLLPAPKPGSPIAGERLISPLVEAKRVRWTLMRGG